MASYRYPNITIVDETDHQRTGPNGLEHAVVAKFPESARYVICLQNICNAIQEQFDAHINVEDIAYYGPDFLIVPPESTLATLMLARAFLNVSTFTLALIPWTTEYGSTTVPLHTQLGNTDTINFNALTWHRNNPSCEPPRNQNMQIQISGIPPHLCCQNLIHRLLDNMCAIKSMSFWRNTLTYTVCVHAPEPFAIPNIAHIGIKKTTQNGVFVNIWTLWYDAIPLNILGAPHSEESPLPSITRRGSSAMHTEDRQEYIERLFAEEDDEATSRLQAAVPRAYANSDSSDWEPYTP